MVLCLVGRCAGGALGSGPFSSPRPVAGTPRLRQAPHPRTSTLPRPSHTHPPSHPQTPPSPRLLPSPSPSSHPYLPLHLLPCAPGPVPARPPVVVDPAVGRPPPPFAIDQLPPQEHLPAGPLLPPPRPQAAAAAHTQHQGTRYVYFASIEQGGLTDL